MRAVGGDGLELDRAEAIGQVHGENSDQQYNRHGHAGQRYDTRLTTPPRPRATRPGSSPRPTAPGMGTRQRLEDMPEGIGSPRELGVAVLQKAVADDETQWNRGPTGHSQAQPLKASSKALLMSFIFIRSAGRRPWRSRRCLGRRPARIMPIPGWNGRITGKELAALTGEEGGSNWNRRYSSPLTSATPSRSPH